MKRRNRRKSYRTSLYSYNSRTNTYSFQTLKKKRRGFPLKGFFVLILILGAVFLVTSAIRNLTGRNGTEYTINLEEIPSYSGVPYVEVNGNVPLFSEKDYTLEPFEKYSRLDKKGRCGTAYANICQELMPTEEREDISEILPTGFINAKYDHVDEEYLYNRCHLIGYQLAGENANEKNLITGTRYLNVEGMLPFENKVASYVRETGNHVLYRVTPIFEGKNLVASGVQMEAYSVEDEGEGISFHVYVYNVQPGVEIDYRTGESWEAEG